MIIARPVAPAASTSTSLVAYKQGPGGALIVAPGAQQVLQIDHICYSLLLIFTASCKLFAIAHGG